MSEEVTSETPETEEEETEGGYSSPGEGVNRPTPPVGANGSRLEGEALKTRLERERKKWLKEHYGTDDPNKVAELKRKREEKEREYEELKRKEEARKRSRLTAEQRAQQEIQRKDQRIAELEAELKKTKQETVVREQDARINEVAVKFVRPERLKYARRDLAEYLNSLEPQKLKTFNQKKLESWFENFAKENPDFAMVKSNRQQEPRRRPVTTGPHRSQAPKPAPKDGPGVKNGKTVRPGPNAMSKAELREELKRKGIKPW